MRNRPDGIDHIINNINSIDININIIRPTYKLRRVDVCLASSLAS